MLYMYIVYIVFELIPLRLHRLDAVLGLSVADFKAVLLAMFTRFRKIKPESRCFVRGCCSCALSVCFVQLYDAGYVVTACCLTDNARKAIVIE